MGKKIRVGIIGTGGIANAHMNQYKIFDDVEVVCGADIVPVRQKNFFEDMNMPRSYIYRSS